MWATAEKVVPKSIPTALRWFIFGEVMGTRARILPATFVPKGQTISKTPSATALSWPMTAQA
jgi:hypothetical protein